MNSVISFYIKILLEKGKYTCHKHRELFLNCHILSKTFLSEQKIINEYFINKAKLRMDVYRREKLH